MESLKQYAFSLLCYQIENIYHAYLELFEASPIHTAQISLIANDASYFIISPLEPICVSQQKHLTAGFILKTKNGSAFYRPGITRLDDLCGISEQ